MADQLSQRLQQLIDEAKVTQEGIALDADLAKDTVGRWIRGEVSPRPKTLATVASRLSELLGRPIDLTVELGARRAREALAEPSSDRALLAGYLERLSEALNHDAWTAVERHNASGHAQVTAIQQRLRIRREGVADTGKEEVVAVDELVTRCERLVILGGPGTGKSWAARRIVIDAATRALDALRRGGPIDTIEVPYFATCAEVLDHGPAGSRWARLVEATLGHADDTATEWLPLTRLLSEGSRRLAVLDGFDEVAQPSHDALTQLVVAHRRGPLRLVVTSRPGSWSPGHLAGVGEVESGDLQPFTRHDAHEAVAAWLDDVPEARDHLLGLLENRSSPLGQQAKIPLLCAMFCLAARPDANSGSDGGVSFDLFHPGRRLELYDTVIERLLRATWRGMTPTPAGGRDIEDVITDAVTWLEGLAEDGIVDDPTTRLGKWPDAVQATRPLPDGAAVYVDHVAPPTRRRPGAGRRPRRFVHRGLREHLVAKALGRRPASAIAAQLLPHLWFDNDWTEVVPAVIASHPQADELLAELMRRVQQEVPNDPYHALDRALCRAGAVTTPNLASPLLTDAVHQARVTLASHKELWLGDGELAATAHWGLSNPDVRARLVARLDDTDFDHMSVVRLCEIFARLEPSSKELSDMRARALARVASPRLHPFWAKQYAQAVVALGAAPDELNSVRAALLARLGDPGLNVYNARHLAQTVMELRAEPEEIRPIRIMLLARLRDDAVRPSDAEPLAQTVMELRAEPEEIRPIRAVLLARLRDDAVNDSEVGLLATALASLGSSPTEIGAIHAALLPRLDNPELTAYAASRLVDTAVLLIRHPSAEEDALRTVLLERLKDPDTAPDDLPGWAHAVLGLRPTPADIDPVRRWLLARLDDPELRDYVARSIARAVMYLEPTPEQVPDVRAHLVALALVHLTSVEEGNWLLESIMRLQPLPEELRAIRAALQAKLTDSELDLHPSETKMLAEALALAQPSRDDAGHLAAHAPADTETGATLRSQLPFDDWTYYLAAHQGRPQ